MESKLSAMALHSSRFIMMSRLALLGTLFGLSSSPLAGPVTGNGEIKTETRAGKEFNAVRTHRFANYMVGDCNLLQVETRRGTKAGISITAEANIIPLIKTSAEGDEIKVSVSEYFKPTRTVLVVVTSTRIGPSHMNGMGCAESMVFRWGKHAPQVD